MGIGPWDQAYLIRQVQKTEHARFRRILDRLAEAIYADLQKRARDGLVVRADVKVSIGTHIAEGRRAITPKKPKKQPKSYPACSVLQPGGG